MKLLLRWLFSAATLLVLAYYMPGISVQSFYSALVAALVLGLINAIIRPVLIVLTLPVNILTLGLFIFIINAVLFWFAATIVKGFYVAGFWPAFWGALVMSVASWVFSSLFKNRY